MKNEKTALEERFFPYTENQIQEVSNFLRSVERNNEEYVPEMWKIEQTIGFIENFNKMGKDKTYPSSLTIEQKQEVAHICEGVLLCILIEKKFNKKSKWAEL